MSVEKEAVKYAMEFETKAGRNPINVSRDKMHKGYDIICDDRVIEVKGRGKDKAPQVLLNEYNIMAVENDVGKDYYLYVVMNPENNPNLVVFTKTEVLSRKKEKRQWIVPLRTADYSKKHPSVNTRHLPPSD
ncbi:DUF3883 domain-containing protein [Candidatus Woesearchaeota archaeon]|nr:DUF3883 domain-containing protein [Candidatus Woesearchaeota archaeon]MBI2660887.1 DUF3883 domain-containing protein [Candidatus Woesearchaeota archaeon]